MVNLHRLRPDKNNNKPRRRHKDDDPDANLAYTDWLFALIAILMLCIQWFNQRGG